LASKVHYKASVERDLKKLDKPQAKRVMDRIERDLAPHLEKGEALKGTFQGLYRYRIGDYRVIYAQTVDGILVLRVAHRRESYDKSI
jgi:mRNA interferase RelE/StbE